MKRVLTNTAAVVVIVAVSAFIALLSLDPLAHLSVFGSCFEGGCGYVAFFLGFPVITLVLSAAGCAIWFFWRSRRQ